MKSFKKTIAMFLSLLMLITVITGCGANQQSTATTASTTIATTAATTTAPPPPVNLNVLYNMGSFAPEGYNFNDNEYIDVIEKMANVELEFTVPAYSDYNNKLQLIMASADLPDIIQGFNSVDGVKYGDQGAFIDLKNYYDNSTNVKKRITAEMLEFTKSTSGKYYRIPQPTQIAPDNSLVNLTVLVRYDLIQKYNNGKYPESVDEWTAYLRMLRKELPNAALLSDRMLAGCAFRYVNEAVFYWFGVTPYKYRMENGNFISTFTTPEYKEAVKLLKVYYNEGILQKDFATMDTTKWVDAVWNKDTAVLSYDNIQVYSFMEQTMTKEGKSGYTYAVAPPLKTYPAVVKDIKYTMPINKPPVNDAGLYIANSSKNKDAAWKVIDALASDEFYNKIYIGQEGKEFTTKNSQKVINPDVYLAKDRMWLQSLGHIFGVGAPLWDIKRPLYEEQWGKERYKVANDSFYMSTQWSASRGFDLNSMIPLIQGVTEKVEESNLFISEASVKAVMGQISMDDFDKKVAEFKTRYGFISDAYTKFIQENKAALKAKGAIEVDW
ncbi:MAG: hypothetical protein A2Y21_07205 [Clostridiales bacterium GWC2_40_7]|nr:MAG: hypothetical protein A2Y21_07205 [Clostridiales bacterium GWC2_40_7]